MNCFVLLKYHISTPLCSRWLHLSFPAAPDICLSECFPHRPQNPSYPPSPAWPRPGQLITRANPSSLHYTTNKLVCCTSVWGPDCISLLIRHCLDSLSTSLWHFQLPLSRLSQCPPPVRHLLSLHGCPGCLTVSTCHDWPTPHFKLPDTHEHTSHLQSACEISIHAKRRLLLFMPETRHAQRWDYQFLLSPTWTMSAPFYANCPKVCCMGTESLCFFPLHLKNQDVRQLEICRV